jgi:hypothetical protein
MNSCLRLALRFQAPAETGGDKTAEGKTEQGQRQIRVLFPQPGGSGLGVVDFTAAHVVGAFAGTDATVVETQGNQTGIARGALQGRDHLVEHGAALHRVGMADQREAARLSLSRYRLPIGRPGHQSLQGFHA